MSLLIIKWAIKVEAREAALVQRSTKHMPIAINVVSTSRRKKVAVDVVPAKWQTYIAQ